MNVRNQSIGVDSSNSSKFVSSSNHTTTTTTTTAKPSYISLTLPPEQYRFIPGSPPTFINKSTPTLKEPSFNGTGYYIEDGEPEAGLNDIQTLFLACFATLIPLVIILVTAFTIRFLWRRYKRQRDCIDYDGVIHRESNSEPLDRPLHSHLLNGDKLSETHLSTDEACDGTINNGIKGSSNHSTTNGSIITMTLKNNHLIVETEERNDLEEDSRETTMKYSPSARDGVFVVEVQQGVRRSPSSFPPAAAATTTTSTETNCTLNDQCALIHHPPESFNDDDTLPEEDERFYVHTTSRTNTPDLSKCQTGLTQSNQSLTNQSYAYSNQHEYDNGFYGYPNYKGYINDEPMQKLPDRNKPKITSAIYKTPGRESMDLDGPLLSDLRKGCYTSGGGGGGGDEDDDALHEQIRLGNTSIGK